MVWFLSNAHQMNPSEGDGFDLHVLEEIRSIPLLEGGRGDSVATLLSSENLIHSIVQL